VGTATAGEATWKRRVRGSLLLSACADALGAPFEGDTVVDPAAVDVWLKAPTSELRWTDDTALSLALAEHLIRTGGTVDQDTLATDFARAWAHDPSRGYDQGAATVLARINQGVPWSQAAGQLFDGQGSYGNGAAMRVAPIGLVPGLGPSAVAARARRSAAITHAHPHALDGAAVQAVAVAITARSNPATPINPDELVACLAAHAHTPEFRKALQRITPLLRGDPDPAQVAAELGNDITATGSVPAAVAAFLRTPQDATAAIRFAINLGGDTDTIAAMTGALAGARLGDHGLPAVWEQRLEAAARISTLATALADLSTGHQPEPGSARSHCGPESRPPRHPRRRPQPPPPPRRVP
jgi:poly(ADP-ribose) glycohydrolase ARH3